MILSRGFWAKYDDNQLAAFVAARRLDLRYMPADDPNRIRTEIGIDDAQNELLRRQLNASDNYDDGDTL